MKCYAANLGNCAGGISREHYISKSVLDLAGKTIRVSGFPWQAPDESLEIGVNAFTSKILCNFHNQQLSVLDNTGKMFLGFLQTISKFAQGEIDFLDETLTIQGDMLERWLLKVLCGIAIVSRSFIVPNTWVDILFQRKQFPEGLGLHFFGMPGSASWYFNLVRVIPVISTQGNVAGAKFGIGGLSFLLAFGKPQFEEPGIQSIYRPASLIFKKGSNIKFVNLVGDGYRGNGSVIIEVDHVIDQKDGTLRSFVDPLGS